MAGNNRPIGTCPCPVTGCSATCAVKKFEHRSTRDTGVRYAGKLYLICPEHGRLGMDGKDAMQEYILGHATIPNRDDLRAPAPPAVPPSPPAAPATSSSSPAPAKSAPAAPARSKDWW